MDGAVKKKLIEARRRGASFEELRELLKKSRPDTRALAGAFAANVMAGLRGERSGENEKVEASHKKGCNQFKCRPGCSRGSVRSSFGKLNEVATVNDLNQFGINKVYIDKNIIGKIISKMRVKSKNVIRKLQAVISPPYAKCSPYIENGINRINIYKTVNGQVQYVVIDLSGENKGKITTFIPRATTTHLQKKGLTNIP